MKIKAPTAIMPMATAVQGTVGICGGVPVLAVKCLRLTAVMITTATQHP